MKKKKNTFYKFVVHKVNGRLVQNTREFDDINQPVEFWQYRFLAITMKPIIICRTKHLDLV